MNDQPNGRSKHDPRQSSHNRDPLEKKIFFLFFFSSIGEWKRRSRPPSRGGIGRRAGGVGVPPCPALPFRFLGISAILAK